jgi:IS30 family transposase
MAGSPRLPRERVRAFWRARLAGSSVADAAASVGVSETGARRWIGESGGMIPDLGEPIGRYLTLSDRENIAEGWTLGLTRAEIARRLGRHRSTIGRELKRHRIVRYPAREPRPDGQRHRPGPVAGASPRPQHEQLRYRASVAQARAEETARRPKPTKFTDNPELVAVVQKGLEDKWSPRLIDLTLRKDHPDRPEMQVSHETIYQELYVQGRGHLRRELTGCLRTGRALRRPRRLGDQRGRRQIPPEIMISQRPAEVADRAVPGHWEGDLILGADNRSAIGTLVERTTRFVMLLHLPGHDHSAERVRDAMIAAMAGLPAALRRSMTWDQGNEMARHAEIRMALDMPVYFCDPHSPWQRGTNENTNGLLRQYFPKSTDLSRYTLADLTAAADQLNDRPRETLNLDSPAERLARLLSGGETDGVASTP